MVRQRNVAWEPPNYWQYVHLQILMDIREEMQRLNALLACRNFTDIPTTLRAIERKIPPRKKKRPAKAKP